MKNLDDHTGGGTAAAGETMSCQTCLVTILRTSVFKWLEVGFALDFARCCTLGWWASLIWLFVCLNCSAHLSSFGTDGVLGVFRHAFRGRNSQLDPERRIDELWHDHGSCHHENVRGMLTSSFPSISPIPQNRSHQSHQIKLKVPLVMTTSQK